MKRLLSINLALVLLICLFSVPAFGAEYTNETGVSSLSADGTDATAEDSIASMQIYYTESTPDCLALYSSSSAISTESANTEQGSDSDTETSPIILYGNGGVTKQGETRIQTVTNVSSPGQLSLYSYTDTFENGEKVLLGWSPCADEPKILWARDYELCFSPDIAEFPVYAVWESDTLKALYLNNYYGKPPSATSYSGETRVIAVYSDNHYVLPKQSRSSYTFDGWRGEDGHLYPAGTSVMISDSMEFAAEFTAQSLLIDGEEFDASQPCGSRESGWLYYGGEEETAQLTVFNNYSGKPIRVPGNVRITLYKSLSGTTGIPAIQIDGDAEIRVYRLASSHASDDPIILMGGDQAPAIACTGKLTLSATVVLTDQELMLILRSGSSSKPALTANEIIFPDCAIYSDVIRRNRITTYSDEPYLKLIKNSSAVYPETPEELNPPVVSVTTRASDGKPYITWSSVTDATGYEVWRCDTKNGSYTKLRTTAANDFDVVHTGAEVGEDYFYKVRAVYDDLKGDFSTPKGVWCDLKRPTVTVSNRASDGKPYISWTAVEGATGYEVYRSSIKNGTYTKMYTAPADDLDIVHIGARVGEDYFYKVIALYEDNTKCNSAFSTPKGVWCDLKQPTVTVTNRASDGKPYIRWTAVEGATGYAVYRSSTKNATYTKLYTAAADDLDVIHVGAVAGETYFYKVRALYEDNSKCNSALTSAKGIYCDLARPNLAVSQNNSGKPYLFWTEVTGADGYEVYRSTDSRNWSWMYTAAADDFDVIHIGAEAGETYYYKVRAICQSNYKATSAFSTVRFITSD